MGIEKLGKNILTYNLRNNFSYFLLRKRKEKEEATATGQRKLELKKRSEGNQQNKIGFRKIKEMESMITFFLQFFLLLLEITRI